MFTRNLSASQFGSTVRVLCFTSSAWLAFLFATSVAILSGCGSMTPPVTPPPPAVASVPMVVSTTANDKLSEFTLSFNSLTLTNKSGATVTAFSKPQNVEFIHSNATAAPLITASIPEGVYVSATASIGNSSFTCETLNSSGGLDVSIFAYGSTPSSQVTVNLPSPITIDNGPMGLTLDLLATQSATFTQCNPNGIEPFTISPTFNLTALPIASQPTSPANGKETAIRGRISAVAASGGPFIVVTPFPESLSISVNSGTSTLFQGINDFSSLAAGMFVDLDTATQSDGSLLATRVVVFDQAATNVMTGPLSFVDQLVPALIILGRQQQGDDYSVQATTTGYYSVPSSTVFQTSSEFTNIQSLPFPAVFNGSNMVPGQHVAIFSKALTGIAHYPYTAATTVTLLPQTINGTVSAISSQGNFTVYIIDLAAYDLFPTLAVQPGQASLLLNPSQVQVYLDGSATLLNTNTVSPGAVSRFTGLVFNDNGTLRMDCNLIRNGVPE